jgi:hypothetical protein
MGLAHLFETNATSYFTVLSLNIFVVVIRILLSLKLEN